MQRYNHFRASTYVLFIVFTFAALNCDSSQVHNPQAELTAELIYAVRSNWARIMSPLLVQTTLLLAALGSEQNSTTEMELLRAAKVGNQSKANMVEILIKVFATVTDSKYLYPKEGVSLNEDFKIFYSTGLQYNFATKNKEAAEEINERLEYGTQFQVTKEKEIVKASSLNANTTMVSLLTTAFEEKWDKKMSYNETSNTLHVTGRHKYGYLAQLNATAIALPLVRGKYNLLIIYSEIKGALMYLGKNLRTVDVTKIPEALHETKVNLSLPVFNIQTVYSVNTGTLKRLKVNKALTREAEFVDFFKEPARSFIKDFKQFSRFEINVKGVKYSSATATTFESTDSYFQKNAFISEEPDEAPVEDNPYFYFLIDKTHKYVLAAGSSYNNKNK